MFAGGPMRRGSVDVDEGEMWYVLAGYGNEVSVSRWRRTGQLFSSVLESGHSFQSRRKLLSSIVCLFVSPMPQHNILAQFVEILTYINP